MPSAADPIRYARLPEELPRLSDAEVRARIDAREAFTRRHNRAVWVALVAQADLGRAQAAALWHIIQAAPYGSLLVLEDCTVTRLGRGIGVVLRAEDGFALGDWYAAARFGGAWIGPRGAVRSGTRSPKSRIASYYDAWR